MDGNSYIEEQLKEANKRLKEKLEEKLEKEDVVNHPKHYTQGAIECIEVIKYVSNKLYMNGYEGFCLGNFIKYIWRCNNKNGWEDIDKAIFYLDKFLAEQEK